MRRASLIPGVMTWAAAACAGSSGTGPRAPAEAAPTAAPVMCGPPPTCRAEPVGAAGAVELWAYCDLPAGDERSHGLSGITWDPAEKRLLLVRDHPTVMIELRPDASWKRMALGRTWKLEGTPRPSDTEGIAIVDGGLLISDEEVPGILRVTRDGRVTGKLRLPAIFDKPRYNKGIEAMGTTPDGKTLVFANEQALPGDGPMSDERTGTTVRVVRQDFAGDHVKEVAYRSDPTPAAGGVLGITDVVPLSASDVLVTERSYVKGLGNRVRLYRVDLDAGVDVTARETLDAAAPIVEKRLLLDFAALPDCGLGEQPAAQATRLLANIEGVALGPTLPDGRRLLVAVADDNGNVEQVARVIVLAVRGI